MVDLYRMPKPNINLIPPFYQRYINAVPSDDLIPALITGGNTTADLFRTIPETLADYCYEEGKWSTRQVINHMMDAERVFCYRALTFSRNDRTELPGFDENSWTPRANASGRKLSKLIDEYLNLRASTVDLFSSFTEEMLDREGTASGVKMNVATLGFLIAGHEQHHCKILTERYFSN
ncbi:MAG: DinB family protein [Bacteroidota bacterium]